MSRRILYIQYTNPAGYPPLQHSSRMLADRGWQVLFLGTGAVGADSLRFPPHANVEEKRIAYEPPGWKQKVQFAYYALWVLAHVVWRRPDWVYASDWLATPAALLASWMPGVKLAYHEHDSPMAGSSAFARLCWWTRRAAARRADVCVLPSEHRAAVFTAETGAAARVVWNCPSRTEIGVGKSGADGSRLLMVYHGSIVRERLPLELVDAMAQLPEGVRLRIFGYEPNPSDPHVPKMMERARALGIAERIEFRGAIPARADLLAGSAEGDIGLSLMPMTSGDLNMRHMTGASNKPFDYLSQGLPLIVSDLAEWRETFVDRGWAVACNPQDVGSIAAAIRWYWEHRAELVEMGERGRQQIAQVWNYEAQFAAVLAELEKGWRAQARRAGGRRLTVMSNVQGGLVVVETHPIQYRVPVYRELEQLVDAPVTMIFGSDFSVSGYYDQEFRSSFAWDTELLPKGSDYRFLSRMAEGGARNYDEVRAEGLGALLDELKPRAVLLTGYTNPLDRGAIARALTRRIPVLFRAETTDKALDRGALKAAVRRAVLRRLYGRFRGLLAIGKNSYQHYLNCGVSQEKLWLAPYCVSTAPFQCGEADRERLRGVARRELETPDDAVVILFSGKLSKRKGPDLLLDAVRRLPEAMRQKIAVWFLGDGAERQALEEQGRGMACRFLGFRNQTELSTYYHGADVLALPSVLSETWGLVVNEALHHGLPAVVSDGVGSAPDLIERGVTGDVAKAGSVEELAGALERTIALAGRPAIREACRRKMEGYSVRRAAEGIAQAFASLNGGGRR